MKLNPVVMLVTLLVIIQFVLVFPIRDMQVVSESKAYLDVMYLATDLIDETSDSGILTQARVNQFHLDVHAKGTYNIEIEREMKIQQPDPKRPGHSIASYVAVTDIYNYNAGDRINVKLTPLGANTYESGRAFSGSPQMNPIVFSRRIRGVSS